MKLIKTTFVFFFITLTACAQTPGIPTPPTPPNTIGSSHTEVVTSSSSSSSSSRNSSSTSVSDENTSYKFRAKFHSSKRKGIENILTEALDGIQLRKRNRKLEWEILQGGDVLFECTLNKNRLSIFVDKELSTGKFNRRIKRLGEDIQEYISSHKRYNFASRGGISVSRAEERLERAKRELENSIKNLEEVKRDNEK
ncbi:hypothetical protein BTO06_05595 [Tenacibaculum sp. SZ-18]|uniref:hypothetical protein n=1 Tax=Tenacibaculum sp. SZ-18 TaxID=754423 RepID=UPI000C2D1244|nr:hypothetical protein [Tenacibaculum sp. SZ-18]AUC14644.1 hypothetical protein BTO06_05595 [Tenacibaculum sp. SZ-18]